jgi:hypothetical protein
MLAGSGRRSPRGVVELTGSARPDAAGSIIVGGLLAVVAIPADLANLHAVFRAVLG